MKKYSIGFLLLFLIFLGSFSCGNSDNNSAKSIDVGEQSFSYEFDIEPTYSSGLSIDRDDLQNIGIYTFSINGYFISPYENFDLDTNDPTVLSELIISIEDSFQIKISNCLKGTDWNYSNDDSNLILEDRYTADISAERYDIYFIFSILKDTKGYIGFYESQEGVIYDSNSKGIVVGYTTNPIEKLWVDFENIVWNYDLEGFSSVSIRLKGVTNLKRIKIKTFGDGELGVSEIPIGVNGNFDTEISIAFSHVENIYLTTDTQIALYGTFGAPIIIDLENPM